MPTGEHRMPLDLDGDGHVSPAELAITGILGVMLLGLGFVVGIATCGI
jgi:hypothetical protein